MSIEQLSGWLQTANSSEKIVYYKGYLGKDRCYSMDIGKIGTLFLDAYKRGVVVLTQKRITYGTTNQDPVFEYIAQKI